MLWSSPVAAALSSGHAHADPQAMTVHVRDRVILVGQQSLLMDTAQDAPGSESNDLGLDGETPSWAFRHCSTAINDPNE